LVDTCGNCQGYISDTTRTFVLGRFDPETRIQLDSLNQIRLLIQQELRPGVNLGSLYGRVLALSRELGIEEHFMGDGSDKVAFVGHGVGLELDDLPVFYSGGPDLVSGNVVACEPKLVFLGKKLLGIEDTFAVTETGCRRLSRARDSYEI
jgi:Xaa-Pro aminopeptidase